MFTSFRPKSSSGHQDFIFTLKSFAIIFVALVVFLGAISMLFAAWDQRLQAERNRADASFAVDRSVQYIQSFVEAAASDIRIVAQDRLLPELIDGKASAAADIVADFEVYLTEKPAITQLRLLDVHGMETVRVDRIGDEVVVLDPEELQDKSSRYYFQNAIGLSPDGIYLSALDLNLEHGVVQEPWRPVLRLAVPVAGADGRTAGLVVMNLAADSLIAEIEGQRYANGQSIALLNDGGYWLTGGAPQDRWGFVFGTDATLAKTDPELWRQIQAFGTGTFVLRGAEYTVATVWPSDVLARARAGLDFHHADEEWIVLAEVPEPASLLVLMGWPRVLMVLALSAILSFLAARAIRARRRAELEQEAAESKLVHADRLASLGSLVAGISHELNTPLGNAIAVGTTLKEHAATLDAHIKEGRIQRATLEALVAEISSGAELVVGGVERASVIVRHFEQVAADQTVDRRRPYDIQQSLQDIAGALSPQFRGTSLVLSTDIQCATILDGYPGALTQVITNLVTNARLHGFDPGESGEVTIGCRDLPADGVEIFVRDTGKGMGPDTLNHIFDPFFTTRLGSGGSGIGLAIVYNIVTRTLGGHISVSSAPGKGTEVRIELPVSAPEAGPDVRRREYDVTVR